MEESKYLIGEKDEPIQFFGDDALSLQCQIGGFADFIKNCDTPMTISIEGDWGSGKTSFYNAVKSLVQESDKLGKKYLFVDFNAWQYSQFKRSDNLAIDLFYSIVDKIEKTAKGRNKEVVQEKAHKTQETISRVGKMVQAGLLGVTDAIAQKFLGLELSKYYKDVKEAAATRDEIEELLTVKPNGPDGTEVIASLNRELQDCINSSLGIKEKEKESDKRIIVFVDDLDRLVPDKALEMLEALKIFLDCRNCVFILAIDYKVVVNGVKLKYKDTISVNKGNDFFEKLIQVVYKVPTVTEHSEDYIVKILQKNNIYPLAASTFASLLRAAGKENPRTVKRLLNNFLLLRKMAENKEEIPNWVPEDEPYPNPSTEAYLFAFICLRDFNEYLYNEFINHAYSYEVMKQFVEKMDELKNWLILVHPELLNGSQGMSADETEKANLEARQKVLLSQLKLSGEDLQSARNREFLFTFFQALMHDKGYKVINSMSFAKVSLCDDNYYNRIREALLLTDVSGVGGNRLRISENVSAIVLYKDNEDDTYYSVVEPFYDTYATVKDAYKRTLELVLDSMDPKLVTIAPQEFDFIVSPNDPVVNEKFVALELTKKIGGLRLTDGQTLPKEVMFYSSPMDITNLSERLDEAAQKCNCYVEWYRGLSMKLVGGFGDKSTKLEYLEYKDMHPEVD